MIWIDSLSHVKKGITVGSCKVKRLHFADDLALLAFSEQDLQHAFDRFAATCDQAGMNISAKRTEVFCLFRSPSSAHCRYAEIHCSKLRSSSTLGWYFRVVEGRKRTMIHDW